MKEELAVARMDAGCSLPVGLVVNYRQPVARAMARHLPLPERALEDLPPDMPVNAVAVLSVWQAAALLRQYAGVGGDQVATLLESVPTVDEWILEPLAASVKALAWVDGREVIRLEVPYAGAGPSRSVPVLTLPRIGPTVIPVQAADGTFVAVRGESRGDAVQAAGLVLDVLDALTRENSNAMTSDNTSAPSLGGRAVSSASVAEAARALIHLKRDELPLLCRTLQRHPAWETLAAQVARERNRNLDAA